jgi:hypothetical protein
MHIAAASDSQKEHIDISCLGLLRPTLFRRALSLNWVVLLDEDAERLEIPLALLSAAARGSSDILLLVECSEKLMLQTSQFLISCINPLNCTSPVY